MATVLANPAAAVLPEKELREAMTQWWNEQQLDRRNDPFAPNTLYDALTDIDSLSAVNVLLVLDPIVDMTLPDSIIKPGGYRDRQEMIDHLIPSIKKLFSKRTR
jgi:hypothetical protein